MSGACPNKICIVKGNIEVTPGQHYANVYEQTTWRWQGWNHPLIAPINEYNVQVHHFKWDSTVLERLKEVSETKKDYSYWQEYKKMYRGIQINDWKIDINNPEFMFEKMEDNSYFDYTKWNELSNVIIKV